LKDNYFKLQYNQIKLLICFFLVLATILTYWQIIHFDFVAFDDPLYVTENSKVQDGLTYKGIAWAFTTFHASNWHPITWLSHMLDCEIYGLNPMGHHWTNLQLHIANTLLLFFILQQMTGALWKSAFVAALFALHPLHVESVAWIAERKDVLSTFLGMLTILAYISYVKKRNVFRYFLVVILLSLGLMAKSMLVTFPFVLLLLDFWPLGRLANISRIIWEKIPLFVPVVISSVLTFMAQQSIALKSLEIFSLKTRAANAFISYISYMAKTIWPHHLSVFYPHQGAALSLWHAYGAAFLIACVSFFALRKTKQYPYIAFGLFWFLVTLTPVIGMVQVGDQAMADRYTYIPLTGLFIIVTWGIPDLLKKLRHRKPILVISAVTILSVMSISSYFQTAHWKNSIELFKQAIKVTDDNLVAHNNLGTAFFAAGKPHEAIFHYKAALKIKPNIPATLKNLAAALFDSGNTDDAILYYKEALRINPKDSDSHYQLGNIQYQKGQSKAALFHYEETLRINPDHADAHNNLANLLFTKGKPDKAVFHYKEAIRIDPKHAGAYFNLGIIFAGQGKIIDALRQFSEVIKINPDHAEAYNEAGKILVCMGKLKTAERFFYKAEKINPDNKEFRTNRLIVNGILDKDDKLPANEK